MKKYNYVYKITNRLNGMEYVGVHSTNNINDNYMGSGTYLCNAKKKYGVDNFEKEIIAVYDDRQSALNKENEIVCADYVKRRTVYNLVLGGGCPKERSLSIKKFKKGEERQRFIDFNNPLDNYVADIPKEDRLIFYANKDSFMNLVAPVFVNYIYLSLRKKNGEYLSIKENHDLSIESMRYKILNIVMDNLDDMAESLTQCYNNQKHKKEALKMLNTLNGGGLLGTGIKVKNYNAA